MTACALSGCAGWVCILFEGAALVLYALAELKRRGLGEKLHLTILGTGPETPASASAFSSFRCKK